MTIVAQEFESTEVHSKYQDTCNGLSETSDSYEDLTDESNACEDDLTLPTVALNAFSLSFPSAEDEFELENSCQSPGLELKLYEIESFPAQKTNDNLTVVFDLDETLVHARDGIIKPRPFVNELLKSIQGRCELLVWTAGVKSYAERVITALDTDQIIKQCICRADSWFPTADPMGHAKDLRLLGRDLSRTIIIENTPDCIVKNPLNSILVPDYNREDPSDTVLQTVAQVLDGLLLSPLSVPEYLASCPLLRLELLRNQSGATLPVFLVR